MKISRLLDKTTVKVYKMSFDDIEAAFNEVEKDCALQAKSDHEILEVKRRIIEQKLRIYCERDFDFATVKKCYEAIINLGNTNLEMEFSNGYIFTNYLIQNGKNELAKEAMTPIISKLDNNIIAYTEFKKQAEKLVQSLDG